MPVDPINGHYYDPNDPDELSDRISIETKYNDTKNKKVGYAIQAKNVIMLDAPEVLLSPKTPLLTNAQDLAGAINELFNEGGGGGDDIYIVSGSENSIIVRTISGRNSDKPNIHTDIFSFSTKQFSIVTILTSNSKTITKTWTKNIITSISNSSGDIIFRMDTNNSGTITACYDRSGNEILHGETFGDSVNTSTPEGIALGWALSYSKEQDEQTEQAVAAYEDGRKDEQEASGTNNEKTEFKEIDLEGNNSTFSDWYDFNKDRKYIHTYICGAIQIFLNDSETHVSSISKIVLKRVTLYESYNIITKEKWNTKYDSVDRTLTSGNDAINNAWKIVLTGFLYDDKGEPYTGSSTWTNLDRQIK